MTAIAEARQALIDAGLVLEYLGHGDMTRGHVSVRVPGSPELFFMKPHSVGFDEITEENILTFDIEGKVVAGTSRPHSERFIHSEILRARPDVNAVIHTHPLHTIAFSATGQSMRALNQGGAVFAGHLPVFTDTMDLIRSQETGAKLARCLGPHNAVLMRSHGVAMAGASLAEAVVLCVMLEEAARIQLQASALGLDGFEFPAEDVAKLRDNLLRHDQFEVNFQYLVRKARRALPR
jgi:L-ribulose-5-phosphate 4-epimerase